MCDILHCDDVGRRRHGWQRERIELQVRSQLIPPFLKGGFLGAETLLHLCVGVLGQRIVHVDEDLVEDDRQATHAHEARGRVGCGGGVLPCDADLLCAKGHPNVFFGRVIDWQMSAWMQGISILQSTYTLSGAEICSSVGWTVNARGTD